jgi:hypothetical protein
VRALHQTLLKTRPIRPLPWINVSRNRRMESEEWFEQYCFAHGIEVVAHEPDLGVPTHPDFLVSRDGVEVVCEVKEFTSTPFNKRLRESSGFFSMSEAQILRPVRNQVRAASKNLKPLAGMQWPLVVVLANPRGLHLELDANRLIHALFGDLIVTFRVGPDGKAVTEPQWAAGRNGRLRDNHPYISAVAGLHKGDLEWDWWQEWHERRRPTSARLDADIVALAQERTAAAEKAAREEDIPTGTYYRLDVILNPSEQATPLPPAFFFGERDTVWGINTEDAFERIG